MLRGYDRVVDLDLFYLDHFVMFPANKVATTAVEAVKQLS